LNGIFQTFVDPQSDCRIHCLNGGFCAYLVDNPTVHTCLCLLDLFHGDRCQYSVNYKGSNRRCFRLDCLEKRKKIRLLVLEKRTKNLYKPFLSPSGIELTIYSFNLTFLLFRLE
uniref:EGF-like domain-containing protein n=1 Tax=Dracunculus medinensis TaxID=318479 RepID=A0A0N4UKE7_DRAME